MPVLGKTTSGTLDRPELFPLTTRGKMSSITMRSDEVTALCPVTGQRDYYVVTISFCPVDGQTLESKSLKMFLSKFANEGISCEDLALTIQDELLEVLFKDIDPRLEVVVEQKSRGGITIEATASYFS